MKQQQEKALTKRRKALALFYSGKNRTYINRYLKLKPKKLNQWILEWERETILDPNKLIKEKALAMYEYKISPKKICEILSIRYNDLYNLVNPTMGKQRKVKSKNYLRAKVQKQSGKCSSLIDEIYWLDRVNKRLSMKV